MRVNWQLKKKFCFLLAKFVLVNNISCVIIKVLILRLEIIKEECKNYCFCKLAWQTINATYFGLGKGQFNADMDCSVGMHSLFLLETDENRRSRM